MRPEEREAVVTTIVGGRPPGSGRGIGNIPRGIEILVKKAAVDPAFKKLLIEDRGAAAGEIGLELSPVEAAMLGAIPREQLESTIEQTDVPQESRRAFLGKVAAAMIAALGVELTGCDYNVSYGHRAESHQDESSRGSRFEQPAHPAMTKGHLSDRPPRGMTLGIQPDRPLNMRTDANSTDSVKKP